MCKMFGKKKEIKLESKKYFSIFLVILLIMLIFTFIDFLIHSFKEEWSVPDYYFRNKIIFGTLIGFITYLFVKNKENLFKSLVFSGVTSVLLQIRYFLEGYSIKFVLEFLIIHFLVLFIISLIIFKLIEKLMIERR